MEAQQHRNVLQQGYWLNEYQIDSVLGKPGGFGITYLATDTHLRQLVAIKEYLPIDFAVREGKSTVCVRSSSDEDSFNWGLKCFIEEARVLAKFKHHSIVRVLRFFEANGTAYMVMEYQHGHSLTDYLKQQQTLDEEALLALVLPLLDGLKEIHEANLLHRDIKPNNIYIRSSDNTPVLLDFGSARLAIGQKTRTVTSIVTPGYAPLEQYDNEMIDQGPWTDIYALGAVMYYAITGEPPPAATRRVMKDPMITAVKVGEGKYRKNLLRSVDWALQLSEEDRPQSVEQWRVKMLVSPVKILTSAESLSLSRRLLTTNIISSIVILSLATTLGILWYKNRNLNVEIQAALAEIVKEQVTQRYNKKRLLIAQEKLKIERKHRRAIERSYQVIKNRHRTAEELLEKIQGLDTTKEEQKAEILSEESKKTEKLLKEIRELDASQTPNRFSDHKSKFFDVFNVKHDDVLNVREYPGFQNKIVDKMLPNEICVKYSSDRRILGQQLWIMVQKRHGVTGWVNFSFLRNSEQDCNEDVE